MLFRSPPGFLAVCILTLSILQGACGERGGPGVKSEATGGRVSIYVNFGGIKPNASYDNIPHTRNMTVWDAMNAAKSRKNGRGISFTFKEMPGHGHFITGIDGVKQDVSKKTFWIMCVGGAYSNEGVDTKKLKAGDRVEWRRTSKANPCPGKP